MKWFKIANSNPRTLKVFMDDTRTPPDPSWTLIRTVKDTIQFLLQNWDNISVISLDHDMGGNSTGYDVMTWIERKIAEGSLMGMPQILVHSANPVGRMRMEQALRHTKEILDDKTNSSLDGV